MKFAISGGTLNINFDFLMQYDLLSISALTQNGIIYSPEFNTGITYNENSFYLYSKDNLIYLCVNNFSGQSIDLSSDFNNFRKSSILESLFYNNSIELELYNITQNISYDKYSLIDVGFLSNYVFSYSDVTGIRCVDSNYTQSLINEFVYSLGNENISQYNNNWFYSPWKNISITVNQEDIQQYSGNTFEIRLLMNNFKGLPSVLVDNISIVETIDIVEKKFKTFSSNIGFELEKQIDNIKCSPVKNELILNTKEIELTLDSNNVLEKDILSYILENRLDFNNLISISLSFETPDDLLTYIKNNFVSLNNRKTVKNYYFINELYNLYYESLINNNSQPVHTFDNINKFIEKINSKWQLFIEQLLPSTVILSSMNLYKNNFFNQRNKFVYRKFNLKYMNVENIIYYNDRISDYFTNSTCQSGEGETIVYAVPANKYSSNISKADANNKAWAELIASGQTYADTYGKCIFYNDLISSAFTKNTCVDSIGTEVIYSVSANTYSAYSKDDANALAWEDIIENGQDYANQNGLCIFYNDLISSAFTRNNCGDGFTGSTVIYTVLANEYSGYTKTEANNKAINDIITNGQTYANISGTCSSHVYYNTVQSGVATKNDCGTGYSGTSVTYTVSAGTYSGLTQSSADQLAIDDVTNNKQSYANINGYCVQIVFYNVEISSGFTKNTCGINGTGSTLIYTIPANTYSGRTQLEANQLAYDDLANNGQLYANTNGYCLYFNNVITSAFTRNNCGDGYSGTSITYTVNYGKYTGYTQSDANNLAYNEINISGQTYANNNGSCILTGSTIFTINDFSLFDYSGTSQTVGFTASPDGTVSLVSKPDWVSGVTIDNVNNTITIIPTANTGQSRTGYLVFSCTNGASNVTKTITQTGLGLFNIASGFNNTIFTIIN